MDKDRLDELRRICKILNFAAFFLFLCFAGAAQLGLVDSTAFLQKPLFWFVLGVWWVVIFLWGIFAILVDVKEPDGFWNQVSSWLLLFWIRIEQKVQGKRR